jgi:hypothetical protein
MDTALGEAFARAMAAKDHDRLRELLHPELDFRAMTPKRSFEGSSPDGLIDAATLWFGDDDILGVESVDVDSFADRARVGYRFRLHNGDGEQLVEQQAYLSERDGQIGWLRIMCAGKRPVS